MTTTEIPYLESFGCHYETGDGCVHDDPCDWGFRCNICLRPVDDAPCPDHAPAEVPGLLLTACEATPRHWSWTVAHDGYEGPCWRCLYERATEAHEGCEHSHHRAWRRWRVTHRLATKAYVLGIAKGDTITHSFTCHGCMTGFKWGRSGYLLGKPNAWWACLRRGHVYKDSGLPGICDRCSPDPQAGDGAWPS